MVGYEEGVPQPAEGADETTQVGDQACRGEWTKKRAGLHHSLSGEGGLCRSRQSDGRTVEGEPGVGFVAQDLCFKQRFSLLYTQ